MPPIETPPRGRGRPRIYPRDITATDRKAFSRRVLRAAGGHILTVDLSAAAWTALQRLADRNGRGALVERLILEADRADRSKGAGAGDQPLPVPANE